MNFFGMGPGELMLILIAALIIFGPRKLPEIGGQVGRAIAEFRRATNDLTKDFRDLNLDELTKPLSDQPAAPAQPATPVGTVAMVTPPEGMESPVEVRADAASTDEFAPEAAVVDLLVEEDAEDSKPADGQAMSGNGVLHAESGMEEQPVATIEPSTTQPAVGETIVPEEHHAEETDAAEAFKGAGI